MAIGSRKGSRTWLLLLGAIGFGVAAAILSVVYLKAREAALLARLGAEEQQTVSVVVANQDLAKGTALTTAVAAVRDVPVEYVHPDAITPASFGDYEGKVVVVNVVQGKPILASFIKDDFPIDFSDTIEVGRRAMTISVDEINSQANLTRPGDHIDLFVNIPMNVTGFKLPGADNNPFQQVGLGNLGGPQVSDVVMPVLQDVKVLAVGREGYTDYMEQLLRGDSQMRGYTTMTIDVTPEQAALLTAAQDNGDLIALLRNRKDRGGAKFAGITTADLLKNSQDMHRAALLQKSQRSADGLVVGPDGQIMTQDGIVLKNQDDFVVGEDGVIRTKGETYTDFVRNEDGSVTLADGTVLQEGEYTVNPDGSITTRGKELAGLGLSVNENGEIVGPDGQVVDPNDIIVTKDGIVMTKDGRILKGPGDVKMTKDGFIVTEDGTVMTKDGIVLEGVRVNENGEVVAADGTVLKPEDIVLNEDGSVSVNGKQLAGVTGSRDANRARTLQAALGIDETGAGGGTVTAQDDGLSYIGYIRGGSSEEGVATPGLLPILPVKQTELSLDIMLQQSAPATIPGVAP